MNGIKNADMIFAGSKVNVPNPNYSPIQKVPEMSQMLSNRSGMMGNQQPPMMPQGMPQEPGLEGVDPMELLPVGKAMGAAALAGGMARGGLQALAKAAPVVRPNALGTPNLAGVGQVAMPTARGAVGWPGARPALNNVRPVSNNPAGNASMILNQPGATQAAVREHLARMRSE
jgi:hypothetical protein